MPSFYRESTPLYAEGGSEDDKQFNKTVKKANNIINQVGTDLPNEISQGQRIGSGIHKSDYDPNSQFYDASKKDPNKHQPSSNPERYTIGSTMSSNPDGTYDVATVRQKLFTPEQIKAQDDWDKYMKSFRKLTEKKNAKEKRDMARYLNAAFHFENKPTKEETQRFAENERALNEARDKALPEYNARQEEKNKKATPEKTQYTAAELGMTDFDNPISRLMEKVNQYRMYEGEREEGDTTPNPYELDDQEKQALISFHNFVQGLNVGSEEDDVVQKLHNAAPDSSAVESSDTHGQRHTERTFTYKGGQFKNKENPEDIISGADYAKLKDKDKEKYELIKEEIPETPQSRFDAAKDVKKEADKAARSEISQAVRESNEVQDRDLQTAPHPYVEALLGKSRTNRLSDAQIMRQFPEEFNALKKYEKSPEYGRLVRQLVKDKRALVDQGEDKFSVYNMPQAYKNSLKKIDPSSPALTKVLDEINSNPIYANNPMNKFFLKALEIAKNGDAQNINGLDEHVAEVTKQAHENPEYVQAHEAFDKAEKELKADNANKAYAARQARKGQRIARTTEWEDVLGNPWMKTSVFGGGQSGSYVWRVETDDDGKKWVRAYGFTGGSPDTTRDPVYNQPYQEFDASNAGPNAKDPNAQGVESFAEGRVDRVQGGTKNLHKSILSADEQWKFDSMDGEDFNAFADKHKVTADKVKKLVYKLGGRIDALSGKIYTTSVDEFPEDAVDNRPISDEELEDIRRRKMNIDYSSKNVVFDPVIGKMVYRYKSDDKAVVTGKGGVSWYINYNNPKNRAVLEKYAKMGITDRTMIPVTEFDTVNTSRSTEGNVDWTDVEKTINAYKAQGADYRKAAKGVASNRERLKEGKEARKKETKPSASVLEALMLK